MNLSEIEYTVTYTAIVDMGLIWRLATPTKEDREIPDKMKYTWDDYADKVAKTFMDRHPNAHRLILVNDTYSQEYSIKDSERLLRKSKKSVGNVFMKTDKELPPSQEFSALLNKNVYSDDKSKTPAEARALKWTATKKEETCNECHQIWRA